MRESRSCCSRSFWISVPLKMDTDSKDREPLAATESAPAPAENASFPWETGKLMTPPKHVAEVVPSLCTPEASKTPLNFSTVTMEQLGITPESFVQRSAGKSASSCLKKCRRRSAFGTRGSPETNHLIRFIAQQRSLKSAGKSPLAQDTLFQGSPGLYGNGISLRERISAFQSAFHSIKEHEQMPGCPDFSEVPRKMEAANLKENVECQQLEFPAERPSKRRRLSSQNVSDEELTEAEDRVMALHIFNIDTGRVCTLETSTGFSKKSSEVDPAHPGCLVKEPVPLLELTKASHGLKAADCVEGKRWEDTAFDTLTAEMNLQTVPDVRSPACPAYKRDFPSTETFVLRSVLKKPSVKLYLESLQEHHDNLCDDGTPSIIPHLANCCKEQKAEDPNYKASAFLNMRKRKRVTFGEELSPEVFDESLPANTPLRKGGTPVRKTDLSGGSPLLLERSPILQQLSQPNFDEKGENLENIEPLDITFTSGTATKSPIPETLSGTDTFSSSNNHEKLSCNVRPTRTSNRKKQLTSFVEENVCHLLNTETQPCKEKKIDRRKPQESKHTSRALPKKSRVTVKSCRKKKGRGKKGVQKSLYGKRDIASKKPLLSPIPELPEVSDMTPSAPGPWRMWSDDFNSNDKFEEMKLPKNPVTRENLLPQTPEDLHMNQSLNKCDMSEFYRSYMKNPSSFGANTMDINKIKNAPKVENNLKSEMELNTGNENEISHIYCSSVTEAHVMSDNSKPDLFLQCQELSASGQNAESLCRIFKIPEDIKCEKQDDILVATKGKPQCNHFMSDSQTEYNYVENVLIENQKCESSGEDVGKEITEQSSVTICSSRKQRRRSVHCSHRQSLPLEGNSNHKSPDSSDSSVGISIENSELYEDLSNAIEQSFQRTNGDIKVRRSTRLQKDSDKNEGLVWISVPLASQKTRRRTVCGADSRGLEDRSPRRETVSPGSGSENPQGPAANSSNPPEKRRRRSFCASTVANTETPGQPKCCRRSTFLKKGKGALTGLERVGPSGELKQ
ncbi:cell division cycle-associated protein 2 [Ochotona princeps]|uniref:cell division cycle-associated protein 2 n=1 Tax=Ochotona princeps TaxID=9978 RepID=UPI0027146F79|nr:cell division cycle-associated protein 2 [Ochotona princeps]